MTRMEVASLPGDYKVHTAAMRFLGWKNKILYHEEIKQVEGSELEPMFNGETRRLMAKPTAWRS